MFGNGRSNKALWRLQAARYSRHYDGREELHLIHFDGVDLRYRRSRSRIAANFLVHLRPMVKAEHLLNRIEELLRLQYDDKHFDTVGELYSAMLALGTQISGENGAHVQAAKHLREGLEASKWSPHSQAQILFQQCQGILRAMASDIKGGRLGNLRLEFQGQVFADFLNAAKHALSEERKDVAAVLAAAALEDTLKRYAEAKGLKVEDAELSNVINALKAAGLLSATQGALLKGMIPFRNKALHAEWGKIDTVEVQGVIAFVGEFLSTKFS